MSKHLALVHTATEVTVRELPTPAPGPGEILLAPATAGVCGTDLQILRGLRADPSPVLGHEGVCEVLATGPDVTGLEPGHLVMVNPTHPTDDDFLLGHRCPGTWAQRLLVPATAVRADLVIPVVPPLGTTLPRHLAALIEPLASVIYGRQVTLGSAPTPPASLVVWGDGIVGHLARRWWQACMPGLDTTQVHHTPAGVEFSADPVRSGTARVVRHDDPHLRDVLGALPSPVAAVIATPRDATVQAIRFLETSCSGELTVDVHGGLSDEPVTLSTGVLDVAGVRAANRAGVPHPPAYSRVSRPGGALTVCGHRGVANAAMTAAVDELASAPQRYEDLVTHRIDLPTAARLLTRLMHGQRDFEGRRVLKAAIEVHP